jgi:acyl-CoA thioester hydrolase
MTIPADTGSGGTSVFRTASVFRTEIAAEWIDYNAHLRDAYYSLIFSLATDALMDRIGLDEAYRTRTRCTLYTLEMHIHFLHEVMKTDTVDVVVRILGTDRKRIHAAFDMYCARYPDPVSTAEMMLLHVYQGDEPKSQAFPVEVIEALTQVAAEGAAGRNAGGAITAAGSSASASVSSVAGGGSVAGSGSVAGAGSVASGDAATAIPGSRRMELRSRS